MWLPGIVPSVMKNSNPDDGGMRRALMTVSMTEAIEKCSRVVIRVGAWSFSVTVRDDRAWLRLQQAA